MKLGKFGALVVGACAFLSMTASAAVTTYYVDPDNGSDDYNGKAPVWEGGESKVGPKATIAGAVGLANSGDTVILKPTTYYVTERIVRNTGFILKGGSDNAADTVIDGGGTSSFASVASGSNTYPKFYNLTFRNCYCNGRGGAIDYTASRLTVSNCVFDSCVGTQGGAIGGRGACCFHDCMFKRCRATAKSGYGDGGALFANSCYNADKGVYSSCDMAVLVNCTFEDCTAFYGGAFFGYWCYGNLTNCTFRDNVAAQGGAIGGSVTYAQGCTFIGNVSTNTGGGAYYPDCLTVEKNKIKYNLPVRFSKCTFTENTCTNGGGGAVVDRGNGISFKDCIFERNSSVIVTPKENGSGGALGTVGSSGQSVLTYFGPIEDCVFKDNYCLATSDGKENVFGGRGGAIYGPFDRICGCTFEDNYAQIAGGAIASTYRTSMAVSLLEGQWNYPPADFRFGYEVTNCTFRGNHVGGEALVTFGAQFFGGAINFASCRYTGETYPYYYYELKEHAVLDCVFVSNAVAGVKGDPGYNAPRLGGAVNAPMGVRLERCVFTNNFCEGAGGAVNCYSTNAIADCVFFGNRAAATNCLKKSGLYFWRSACGGALSLQDCPVGTWQELVRCEFTSNSVGGTCGSAVSLGQGNLKVADCTFTGNAQATNYYEKSTMAWGGALAVDPRALGSACTLAMSRNSDAYPITCAVERCTFVGNVSQGAGAALAMPVNYTKTIPGVVGSVRNCLFRDNEAKFLRDYDNDNKTYDLTGTGGAMTIADGLDVAVENCTFVGNAAETAAGSLDVKSPLASVVNCVFHGGSDASEGETADLRLADATVADYCFAPLASPLLTEGFHNRKSNVYPFAPEGDCPWALKWLGGRDQGLRLTWMTDDATDLIGNPRVTGSNPDFGCIERQRAPGFMFTVQ